MATANQRALLTLVYVLCETRGQATPKQTTSAARMKCNVG